LLNSDDFGSAIAGCIPDGAFVDFTDPSGNCITREFDGGSMCGAACVEHCIITYPDFGTASSAGFSTEYEGTPHAAPHNWVDGYFSTTDSCDDPLFFVHHSNVDRLYGMWQDCWDHDLVAQSALTSSQYSSNPANTYSLDTCMPYGSSYLQSPPACITPRMMHKIQGNVLFTEMEYSYTDDSNMIPLLSSNGVCNWDWKWPLVETANSTANSTSDTAIEIQDTPPPTPPPPPTVTVPNPVPSPTPAAAKASPSDPCHVNSKCSTCTAATACGWCGSSGTCVSGTSTGPSSGKCSAGWSWRSGDCDCLTLTSCANCINAQACGWCAESTGGSCSAGTSSGPSNSENCNSWAWTSCSQKRFDYELDNITIARKLEYERNWENIEKKLRNGLPWNSTHLNFTFPKGILGEFYGEAYRSHKPTPPTTYVSGPGKFLNWQVQLAREAIDNHDLYKRPRDLKKRVRAYFIAECMVEGVTSYVTEKWLLSMNMTHMRGKFSPPCLNESLPINIPDNHRPHF